MHYLLIIPAILLFISLIFIILNIMINKEIKFIEKL